MLISELEFGSYLSYTPRGNTDKQKQSKNVMYALKNDKSRDDPPVVMSQYVATRINENLSDLPFESFFGPNVLLVPVPKSSLIQIGSLWVPELIAKALEKQNLGFSNSCLKRKKPLPKAAYSRPSDRPKAIDHYNSLECQQLAKSPEKILLIDDIITRGATLLGSASILAKSYPGVPIKAFAVMRTISNPEDFKAIADPCLGKITLTGDQTIRNP